jgi:hypothetical protein
MSRAFHGRNRKSLDGSVPGIEYTRFRAGQDPGPLDGRPQIDAPHLRQEYDPDPGRMDVSAASYEPYAWELHLQPTPVLRPDPILRPEPAPKYEDGLMTPEVFERALRDCLMDQRQAATEAAERDVVRTQDGGVSPQSLEGIMDGACPPNYAADMLSELEQQALLAQASPEPAAPDPYVELQQMYDEEMMRLMQSFGMPGPGPMM